MPNKVDYRTFSQRVKNKYPEYINMGDLELAQMWVNENPQYGEFVIFDQQPVKKKEQAAPSLGAQGGLPSQQPSAQPKRAKEERFFGGTFGDVLDMLDMPTPGVPGSGLGIGDFIDDMGRAFSSGKKAGVNMSASRPLFFSGPGSSDEEVQNFVKAGTEYTGPSDEATQFYKDYEDNGKTTFGFVKALAKNPGIAPELVVQSASQLLFNPEARAAAGSVILGGASAGAIATAPAGGIGAAPGAIASIPLAVAAANTTVSTLSSFSELMKKELDDRGLEFNEDNVRTILEDENALRKIRAKSAGYGITIGAFDLATAKVGGAIAAKIPMSTRAGKIKATLSTIGVEAVGGSAGEAAARGVTGQELDPAEIGLEGIAEIPGAAPTLLSQVLKRPAYKINGEFVGKADVDDILQNSTRQELENTKLEVFNDTDGYSKKIANRIDELKTRDAVIEANPNASNQEIDLLVGLNTKLKNLNEMDAESAKIAAETIRSEIKTIQKNLLQREISPETEQQAEQIAAEAPQMAPAEVSPEVGMEIPQPQESVLEGPKMPPLEDLEFDNIEFVEPVITPVETQLVGEKKSPLIKETFQGVTRPRRKPGEVRAPLMEQVTEGGVFKAKLRDSKTGTEFIVEDPELSLDLAIAAQVRESGKTEFPQPAFLETFSEVVDSDPELQTLFPNISETDQPLSLEQRTVSLDGKKVTRNVVQRMQPLYAALEQRMNNAEEIPMSEIESVVDQVIQLQQDIQNQKGTKTVRAANGVRQDFTPLNDEQKRIFNDFTDALVNKLLSYDFATTTTTGPTTQKTTAAGLIATPREGRPLQEARVQRERLEGAEVTIEGRGRGRITIKPLPGLGERSVYGITFEETGAVAPETISPTARETGTTPAAVGVEPQTEQDVRQETNAPQEGRGQGEDAAPVPQEEGRQEGQVTPPAVAQEGETPPAAKRTRKTEQQKADESKAAAEELKKTLGVLQAGKKKPLFQRPGKKTEIDEDTQIEVASEEAGISPKNSRDLYRVNRELFGLNQSEAMSATIAMDKCGNIRQFICKDLCKRKRN
ncbi:MAG: hypothetical protein EBR82_32655 [Caulobacteraceae bacterium]|nr:hypothetical protein [Caulobacteraceae bacterium]